MSPLNYAMSIHVVCDVWTSEDQFAPRGSRAWCAPSKSKISIRVKNHGQVRNKDRIFIVFKQYRSSKTRRRRRGPSSFLEAGWRRQGVAQVEDTHGEGVEHWQPVFLQCHRMMILAKPRTVRSLRRRRSRARTRLSWNFYMNLCDDCSKMTPRWHSSIFEVSSTKEIRIDGSFWCTKKDQMYGICVWGMR